MVKIIYLVRHGEIYQNLDPSKSTDITPKGKKQIIALGNYFKNKKVDAVISSKIKRAKITAEVIAKQHKITVKQYTFLNEINGRLVGSASYFQKGIHRKVIGDVKQKLRLRKKIPFLKQIKGNNIVIVAHMKIIKYLLANIERKPVRKAHKTKILQASITKLTLDKGKMKIDYVNDISHLPKNIISEMESKSGD